ncbi:MAG: transglycosylase [Rhodospirillaceae bacterium]|nr:transglycosylase [Rhodospirillaceae bacterium]
MTSIERLIIAAVAAGLFCGSIPDSARAEAMSGGGAFRFAALIPGSIELGRATELPRMLRQTDAALYRKIFEVQEAGDWETADRLIADLGDTLLMGHVLEQRYMHPTAYRSSFEELSTWLARYSDLPGAMRVYRLAMRRLPDGAEAPKRPDDRYLSGSGADEGALVETAIPRPQRSKAERKVVSAFSHEVTERLSSGSPGQAERYLLVSADRVGLSTAEVDRWRVRIATAYFHRKQYRNALAVAAVAAERNGDYLPDAFWIAGLAAERLGDAAKARKHFQALAERDVADNWLQAGGAYWAARLTEDAGDHDEAKRLLEIAAAHPRSFYGLLAVRALGRDPGFNWEERPLTTRDLPRLMAYSNIRRAIALVEVGDRERAEREIRTFYGTAPHSLTGPLLSLSARLGLPAVQMRIGGLLAQADGRRHDDALYPLLPWEPPDGFTIDRALVHAVVRQESGFDPGAASYRGAAGLMQLMPQTASYIDEGRDDYDDGAHRALFDPVLNISLGQRYLRYLLRLDVVGGDLLRLAAAYNGGPGNLDRWHRQAGAEDPLMFIECIPSRETRRFIQRVMANFWIYRMRFSQATPSLDEIVAGDWPAYIRLDDTVKRMAQSGPH